jgi:hypothetical protein
MLIFFLFNLKCLKINLFLIRIQLFTVVRLQLIDEINFSIFQLGQSFQRLLHDCFRLMMNRSIKVPAVSD